MGALQYRARDRSGKLDEGTIEAVSPAEARARLRERGLYVVSIERPRDVRAPRSGRARVRRRELILFAYQLQTVIQGGIPILVGLSDLAEHTQSRNMRRVVEDLMGSIQGGSTLSQALGQHPGVFPSAFREMIHAGESSGRLDDVLARLVALLEWEDDLRGQLRQLVTYPILVLTALAGLILLLLTFVVPKFAGVLTSLKVDLPFPTRLLLGASTAFREHWLLLAIGIGAAIVAAVIGLRFEKFALAKDRLGFRVPVIGPLRLALVSSQLTHFLAAFVESGVPIGQGLTLLSRIVGNRHASAAVREIHDRVMQGDTLSRAFAAQGLFPPLVVRMISIGEESGALPESLQRAETFYAREIPRRVKALIDITGPALTVVLAALLLFVILAVLLPIYTLYNSIR